MPARRPKSKSHATAPRLNRTIPAQHHDLDLPPIRVPKAFAGFIDFVRTQGVVGLGVGFIVGTAANTLIKSVVANLINPVVGLITGGIDLSQKTICLNSAAGVCKDTLNYGQVISDIITFLVILAVVYFVVKSLKLDKLDKPKEAK